MKDRVIAFAGCIAVGAGVMLTAAVEIAPASAQQQFGAGNQLVNESAYAISRERWYEAANLAEEALRSGELTLENIPSAYNNLCVALTGQRQFVKAIDACDKAVDLRPGQWSFYNSRANIDFYQGNFDRALAEYYKAMTFNSGGSVLMHNISLTLEYRKERSTARERSRTWKNRTLASDPEEPNLVGELLPTG